MKRKITKLMVSLMVLCCVLACAVPAPRAEAAAAAVRSAKASGFRLVSGKARITFKVSKRSKVRVDILNNRNKLVKKLGTRTVAKNRLVTYTWNGRSSKNDYVKAGTYKARIYAGKTRKTLKFKVTAAKRTTKVNLKLATASNGKSVKIRFSANAKNDAVIKIRNAKKKLVAQYKFRNVAANKTKEYTWNYRATSGNNAGLSKGALVPDGKYTVQVISGSKSKSAVCTVKLRGGDKKPDDPAKPDETEKPKETEETVDPNKAGTAVINKAEDKLIKKILTVMPIPVITDGYVEVDLTCTSSGKITLYYGMNTAVRTFSFTGVKGKKYTVHIPLSGRAGVGTMYTNRSFYVECGASKKQIDGLYYIYLYYGTPYLK